MLLADTDTTDRAEAALCRMRSWIFGDTGAREPNDPCVNVRFPTAAALVAALGVVSAPTLFSLDRPGEIALRGGGVFSRFRVCCHSRSELRLSLKFLVLLLQGLYLPSHVVYYPAGHSTKQSTQSYAAHEYSTLIPEESSKRPSGFSSTQ